MNNSKILKLLRKEELIVSHKIILILNKDKQRVCEQYCYKELDLDKSIIEKIKSCLYILNTVAILNTNL